MSSYIVGVSESVTLPSEPSIIESDAASRLRTLSARLIRYVDPANELQSIYFSQDPNFTAAPSLFAERQGGRGHSNSWYIEAYLPAHVGKAGRLVMDYAAYSVDSKAPVHDFEIAELRRDILIPKTRPQQWPIVRLASPNKSFTAAVRGLNIQVEALPSHFNYGTGSWELR